MAANLKFFLRLKHDFPRLGPREDEFVGPFETQHEAHSHQALYGPMAATLERLNPSDQQIKEVYTPAEHIDYLKGRE